MNALIQRKFERAADPAFVERPLCIEGGDVQIDAVGCYCGTSGRLMRVEFNGRRWDTPALHNWLLPIGKEHFGPWDRALTREEIEEAAQ